MIESKPALVRTVAAIEDGIGRNLQNEARLIAALDAIYQDLGLG